MLSAVKELAIDAKKKVLNWITPAKPQRIIKIPDNVDKESPVFKVDLFEKIIKDGDAEDLPVFIVSITGVMRSGKSFLLNMMKIYLDYYKEHGTDDKWSSLGHVPVEGEGAWARSPEAVTHGIWIWNRPFIINGIAILLIDSMGRGDTENGSPELDNLLLYLGLQLSNVQILNIKAKLTTPDIECLHLCAECANIEGDGNSDAVFDNLVFLVRDWELDDQFGERAGEFKSMVEKAKSPKVKKVGEGVDKAFKKVSVFTLPHPGNVVAKASEADKSLTFSYIDGKFMTSIQDMFRQIFITMPAAMELPKGKWVMRKFVSLKERTVSGKGINVLSPADALEESLIYQVFIKAHELYDNKMAQATRQEYESKEEAKSYLVGIVSEAIKFFTKAKEIRKYKDGDKFSTYLELLKKKSDVDEQLNFIWQTQQLRKQVQRETEKNTAKEKLIAKYKKEKEELEQKAAAIKKKNDNDLLNQEVEWQNEPVKDSDSWCTIL